MPSSKKKLFKEIQNSIDFGDYEGYITTPLDYPLDVEPLWVIKSDTTSNN